MEVEVTVILDLPEMHRDLLPELPSPVRLKRDSYHSLRVISRSNTKRNPAGG